MALSILDWPPKWTLSEMVLLKSASIFVTLSKKSTRHRKINKQKGYCFQSLFLVVLICICLVPLPSIPKRVHDTSTYIGTTLSKTSHNCNQCGVVEQFYPWQNRGPTSATKKCVYRVVSSSLLSLCRRHWVFL